jgi:hypothetical protein
VIFALFVPSLLPILVGCTLVFVGLDLLISRLGWYRFVWHPALFRAALFTALFCGAGLLLRPIY